MKSAGRRHAFAFALATGGVICLFAVSVFAAAADTEKAPKPTVRDAPQKTNRR